MAIYLGNNKVKLNLDSMVRKIAVFKEINEEILTNIRLISFDDYILKDSNDYYLVAKESE